MYRGTDYGEDRERPSVSLRTRPGDDVAGVQTVLYSLDGVREGLSLLTTHCERLEALADSLGGAEVAKDTPENQTRPRPSGVAFELADLSSVLHVLVARAERAVFRAAAALGTSL